MNESDRLELSDLSFYVYDGINDEYYLIHKEDFMIMDIEHDYIDGGDD